MNNTFLQLNNKYKKLVRKIINKIPSSKVKNVILGFPSKMELTKNLDFLINDQYKGKRFFLFPSPSSPWGYMFQRPHQLARAISQKGYLVLYSVNTTFPENPDWNTRGIYHIDDNIYLFNDGYEGKTLATFADKLIVWQYWPHQIKNIEKMANRETIKILDCIDHISTFIPYKSITNDYELSLEKANIVLATSSSIYKEVERVRPDCMLVPNAVCIEDFNTNQEHSMSQSEMSTYQKIQYLKMNGSALIGYYGAIAEWMDYDLIEEISKKNKSLEFVFIGERYPNIKLPMRENLHFFERMSYGAILNVVKLFDVAILPFKINEITINTSPVKIFEYMAANKPIVSTPLPEVLKYNSVIVADGSEAFSKSINFAIGLVNDGNYLSLLKSNAEENTWIARVEKIFNELKLD